jgi:membrane dipeptidase
MELTRRGLIVGGGALAVAVRSAPAVPKSAASKPDWYKLAVIIDGLSSFSDPYAPEEQMRLSDRARAELRTTGTTAINVTVGGVGNDPDIWEQTLSNLKIFESAIAANADTLIRIDRASDILNAKASGQFGLIFGTQDTSMIGTKLDRLAELKSKGLRIIQLTYNLRNLSGDGALEPDNAGISKLGRATIARIEQEKLLLDLSHGGAQTIIDGIAVANRPLSINHTGCRNVFDHPRNVFDRELKALANKGGVVGIYFMPFLAAGSKPTRDDLIRHIEHAVNICGEDHVSIGTDGNQIPIPINEETWKRARETHEFRSANGFAAPGEGPDILTIVRDYNRLDRFQQLAADLGARGWKVPQIEKLFGRNLLRLYRDAWGA